MTPPTSPTSPSDMMHDGSKAFAASGTADDIVLADADVDCRMPDAAARASGVLLHLTSLPGPYGSGDMGAAAFRFIDWLVSAGQSCWQFLPLGDVGFAGSPYAGNSAFSGNPLLIDLVALHAQGWLDAQDLDSGAGFDDRHVDFERVSAFRMQRLRKAAARFGASSPPSLRKDFERFCGTEAYWLDDYALFMVLSERFQGACWVDWDAPLALRQPEALARVAREAAEGIAFWKFCQWTFDRQWRTVRAYASQCGVRLIGDMPIFVAHNSVDVWARSALFQLRRDGHPSVVGGVPPDVFSDIGQRWGNPLYRWEAHSAEGFRWWTDRLRRLFAMVDMARIDHFRGFESCWEIPAEAPTAMTGRWVRSPGDALFGAVRDALGPLPLIAEDLGVITPEVNALRLRLGLPGMRVLQFAWGEDPGNDGYHLPHRYTRGSVVYTGTHDNDTARGWWSAAPERVRTHVRDYLACDGGDIGWSFVRAACASVAALAIHPMQDLLRLGAEHRMNTPGTVQGNWRWRMQWDDVRPEHASLLARMCNLYGRGPAALRP